MVPFMLFGGFVISVFSSEVFYSLMRRVPVPKILAQYQGNTPSAEWLSAYARWQASASTYAHACGFSIIAAVAFVIATGVYYLPRLTLVASFSVLNLLFAWTAHVFWWSFSVPLAKSLFGWVTAQDDLLWQIADLHRGNPLLVSDTEGIAMLAVFAALVFHYTIKRGAWLALLRVVQAVAGCCVILGGEVLLFDPGEFGLRVSEVQSALGFLVWFTNSDLLYAGTMVFAASTFLFYFSLTSNHPSRGPIRGRPIAGRST